MHEPGLVDVLYIDDLKIFAASREKLRRVMVAVRGAMKDIGLEWNERKCSVAHVERGTLESEEPVVRRFKERSEEMSRRSMVKDTKKYSSEFGLNLSLVHPQPLVTSLTNDLKLPVKKIGMWLKTAGKERDVGELKAEGWQGRLLIERWEDKEVGGECFSWMSEWKTAPTHTIAGLQELYQQLPSKESLPPEKYRDSHE
ncbi:hypothetical protein AWC38_SpisGene7845 [Stylophora pistillata]|uniref:Reverse transcriptase domain-containing protein n=1 Tax=Stylophora pistillata TaxID=50429 RepID=A0A2B4SG18_STYPI|nr:hypothetical protein AWC38_SpisGene7845 [Stylophora pistillata]